MLIFYYIGAISSKKYQTEGLKKVKNWGRGDLPQKGGFSKEGRIKPTRNAFTRKL